MTRITYLPHSQRDWELFFQLNNQVGGSLIGFKGYRYQRGAGIGSIFGSLFRGILPMVKSIGKAVGKQALRTGAHVAADALAGKNIGESLKEHGREGAATLLNKGLQKLQQGHGRKTKQKKQIGRGVGSRPRTVKTKASTIKGLARCKRVIVRKKHHRDQLSL